MLACYHFYFKGVETGLQRRHLDAPVARWWLEVRCLL